MKHRKLILALTLVLLTGSIADASRDGAPGEQLDLVDSAGQIRRPTDYRDRYQALGVYTILDPKGNEMHYTYATPRTAEAYRKTGRFPDGTVLVKEVFATSHAQLTTGDAHWAEG